MTCQMCLDSKKVTNVFTTATCNFRTSTITRHVNSTDHKELLNAPVYAAQFEKSINKALSKEEKGVSVAVKTVYWLAKEGLPLSKYESLFRHINTPDIEHLGAGENIHYSSRYTASELLDAISQDIDTTVTDKLNASPFITILTDETTDIAMRKKMLMYACILDPVTFIPSTHYLTDIDVANGTGSHLASQILQQLQYRNIETSKLMGLGTDGVSAITGRVNGLTGQLLRVDPHIVNIHCVAHRLALCTSQAAERLPALKEYQETLTSLFYYFKGSASRCQNLADVQFILEEPKLKVKEIHQVRWFSFYSALQTVYRSMEALLSYFDSADYRKDPKAVGLHNKLSSKLFLYITYMMMDIMPVVTKLSLLFQKTDVDIGLFKLSVSECIASLRALKENDGAFVSKLLTTDSIHGKFRNEHRIAGVADVTLKSAKHKFVQAIIDNMEQRFPSCELLSGFGVLGMRPLSEVGNVDEWGADKIEILIHHYGEEQQHTYKDSDGKNVTVSSPPIIHPEDTRAE